MEMLPLCDFVMVTCPLTPDTKNLFTSAQFDVMKSSAHLINIARGGKKYPYYFSPIMGVVMTSLQWLEYTIFAGSELGVRLPTKSMMASGRAYEHRKSCVVNQRVSSMTPRRDQ